jgi:hypothetical protein
MEKLKPVGTLTRSVKPRGFDLWEKLEDSTPKARAKMIVQQYNHAHSNKIFKLKESRVYFKLIDPTLKLIKAAAESERRLSKRLDFSGLK